MTMTVLTLYVVWFAHLHIIHVHETTIGKSMIENDIILFGHCDDNDYVEILIKQDRQTDIPTEI